MAGNIQVDANAESSEFRTMISRIHNDKSGRVHVVGIYESNSDHGYGRHPGGKVNIIATPKAQQVVLVLCSYEPVTWNVSIAPGAAVSKIVLGGYHAQKIIGQGANIPTSVHTYEASVAWGANVQIGGEYFYTYKHLNAPSDNTYIPVVDTRHRDFMIEHMEYERQEELSKWRKLFYALESASGETDISSFQGTYKGSSSFDVAPY